MAAAGSPPNSSDKTVPKVSINKLSIESSTLPDEDRLTLRRDFEHKSFDPDELQERVHQATRDLGYFRAVVSKPVLSNRKQTASCESDVTVEISEGPRYHMGQIRFHGGDAIPESQIQSAFAIQPGEPVSPTKIGKGLEALRTLYGTKGYELRSSPSTGDR